jgi:sialidase-1
MLTRTFTPCSVGRLLAAIFLATTVAAARAQTDSGAASVPGGSYDIPPTKEHPRNSEGAFVTLKSGEIAFYYSQFSGGYGDDSASDIAEIHSPDGGTTWSAPRPVIPRGPNQNVMSVSLLRLANGKLAMFYCPTENDISSRPCVTLSEDEGATWTPPSQIIAAAGWYVVNNDRVIQTRSGRIIVPAAFMRV